MAPDDTFLTYHHAERVLEWEAKYDRLYGLGWDWTPEERIAA